jgi:hypothetical protein
MRSIFKLKTNELEHKMKFYINNWSISNFETQKSIELSRACSERTQGLQKTWLWLSKEIYMVMHPYQNLQWAYNMPI